MYDALRQTATSTEPEPAAATTTAPPLDRYVTILEAAKFLHVNRKVVDAAIRRKQIPILALATKKKRAGTKRIWLPDLLKMRGLKK